MLGRGDRAAARPPVGASADGARSPGWGSSVPSQAARAAVRPCEATSICGAVKGQEARDITVVANQEDVEQPVRGRRTALVGGPQESADGQEARGIRGGWPTRRMAKWRTGRVRRMGYVNPWCRRQQGTLIR